MATATKTFSRQQVADTYTRSLECVKMWSLRGVRGRKLPTHPGPDGEPVIRRDELIEFVRHAFPQASVLTGS